MFNKVILIGRLTKDPEVKVTASGIPVGTFTLAVNRSFSSANGEREADFINCVCFRKLAENVGNYVRKGSLINVEGSIQTRSYEGQDGNRRYVTEVICNNVVFLDTRSSNNDNSQYNQYNQGNQYNQNNNNNNYQQQQPTFNINQQRQNQNQNYRNNKINQNDDYFNENNVNVDISEDDLPF